MSPSSTPAQPIIKAGSAPTNPSGQQIGVAGFQNLDQAEQTRISNVARRSTEDQHATANNRLHEQELYRVAADFLTRYPNTQRYTLVYATKDYYNNPFPYAYLIRKPPDSSLHPNLLNLPGGKFETYFQEVNGQQQELEESEVSCALRELKEETGLDGTFPILCGLIVPPPTPPHMKDVDHLRDPLLPSPFLVYCFKVSIVGSQLSSPDTITRKVTESFQWKDAIPNIPLLLSLFYGNAQGWIMQDRAFDHAPFETNLVFTDPAHPYTAYQE